MFNEQLLILTDNALPVSYKYGQLAEDTFVCYSLSLLQNILNNILANITCKYIVNFTFVPHSGKLLCFIILEHKRMCRA